MPTSKKRGGKKAHNKRVQQRNQALKAEQNRFEKMMKEAVAKDMGSFDGIHNSMDKDMIEQILEKTKNK
jgi:hypothetical protein